MIPTYFIIRIYNVIACEYSISKYKLVLIQCRQLQAKEYDWLNLLSIT